MIIGQTLLADTDGSAKTYWSPWFPRGGAGLEFTIDVLERSAGGRLQVFVETKNSEQDNFAGGPSPVMNTGAGQINAKGLWSFKAGTEVDGTVLPNAAPATNSLQGLLELLRFKFVVDSSEASTDWIHIRTLNPSWVSDGS